MISKAPIILEFEQIKKRAHTQRDDLTAELISLIESSSEIQRDADHKYYPRVIGEMLCELVGDTMLKSMEEGKLLGEQLRPIFALLKEAEEDKE